MFGHGLSWGRGTRASSRRGTGRHFDPDAFAALDTTRHGTRIFRVFRQHRVKDNLCRRFLPSRRGPLGRSCHTGRTRRTVIGGATVGGGRPNPGRVAVRVERQGRGSWRRPGCAALSDSTIIRCDRERSTASSHVTHTAESSCPSHRGGSGCSATTSRGVFAEAFDGAARRRDSRGRRVANRVAECAAAFSFLETLVRVNGASPRYAQK